MCEKHCTGEGMSKTLGTVQLSDGRKEMSAVSVTQFFGGVDRGTMIQFSIHSGSFVVASPQDMKDALLQLAEMIEVVPL